MKAKFRTQILTGGLRKQLGLKPNEDVKKPVKADTKQAYPPTDNNKKPGRTN